MLRFWTFCLLLGLPVFAASPKERWVYIPANFQVEEQAQRVLQLLERARATGYRHALIADSKFSRIGTLPDWYFRNVEQVKSRAKELGVELIPALFPVGYSNSLLYHNPNLAEGLPVKEALFVAAGGVARHQPEITFSTGRPGELNAWDFVDDSLVPEGTVLRSPPTPENARLQRKIKLLPFRQYHVSVRVKTRGLHGGEPEIKVLAAGQRSLQWTKLPVRQDQGWTRYDVTFNSLEHTEAGLYFGVWGGHGGDLWWAETKIEECGLVNILRRPGAPVTVRREDDIPLHEGVDYHLPTDPLMGTKPWPGEYTAWHQPPDIPVPGLPDGVRLRVSYFHPHIIYDGQVCACVEEPETRALLRDEAKRVPALWGSQSHLMSHDEWRVLGWDLACRAGKHTAGQIAAENLRFCAGLLREHVPGGRLLVWSDMWDPHHNAVDNYYLVRDSLHGSWEGLERDIVVMNWNFDARDQSLKFFSERGNSQILAGFYDGPLENVQKWLDSARGVRGVEGFLYTTWKQDYTKLEEVAKILDAAKF